MNNCSERYRSLPMWQRHFRNHSNYCANMLCHFGQLRNSSVFTHFFYCAALLKPVLQTKMELFPNGLLETRNPAEEKRNALEALLNPAQFTSHRKRSKLTVFVKQKFFVFYCLMFFFTMKFPNLSKLWNIPLIWYLYQELLCRREKRHIDVLLWPIGFVHFLSEEEEDAVYEGKMEVKMLFYRHSWHFFFIDNMFQVLFPYCTMTWRAKNWGYRQGKGLKWRNEGVNI